jgi:hypothetical protein
MSELRRLQRAMQAHVLQGHAGILSELLETPAAGTAQRMDVYTRAYRLRLLEVLGDHYPALKWWLGEEAFDALCTAYIEAQPSASFNIRWYGDRLAAFAAAQTPWREQAAIAEMATLEWAMTLAFDAADASAVAVEDIARIAAQDWPQLTLDFHPALHRVALRWNVAAQRRAMDREEPLPPSQPLEGAATSAVWRDAAGSVVHRQLEADEVRALDAAFQGADFGALCETLLEFCTEDAVALRAASLLKRWVEAGWVLRASATAATG